MSHEESNLEGIAVIGLAGQFPKANDVETFWKNIAEKVECVTFLTDDELRKAGVDEAMIQNPDYVKAGTFLDDIEGFDAEFFGYSPWEAEILDPQQRLFLEQAWAALENAGYNSETYDGLISVFSSVAMTRYLVFNLLTNPRVMESVDLIDLMLNNDKDFIAMRTSYKLNLRGGATTIQSACSSSLVAIHMACQSLLNGECDMALAGGVTIALPTKMGYMYQVGGVGTRDGHTRTFDEKASGTVFGSGLGVVVLKRLEDAVQDGDRIYSVIKGSAINNDGSNRQSFTAPSLEGQMAVISEALAVADVAPESVQYVEAHGTATPLGDPIEVAALSEVYRSEDTDHTIAIGTTKTHIGHLDVASGVASFIKTTMALDKKLIPPILNFEKPNPRIDFENSPFRVSTELKPWTTNGGPRRAGISSLGFGGTNVHAVLEEAPFREPSSPSREQQLLVFSAKTETALDKMTDRLRDHLKEHSDLSLADAAYTLQVGRRAFEHRRMLVGQDVQQAVQILDSRDPKQLFTSVCDLSQSKRSVSFLFSGTGSQYVEMAAELYEKEPAFGEAVDECCDILQPLLGVDLRDLLYPEDREDAEKATTLLNQTVHAQPSLFVVEYALTRLLQEWGIEPDAMIGHSLGEYVAACLAGVFTLEDALALIAKRAQLIHSLPPGAMLSVTLTEEEVLQHLNSELSLAAVNSPQLCVVAGTIEAIEALQRKLEGMDVACTRVHTTSAFHSHLVEPIVQEFTRLVSGFNPQPPEIPFVSNVTGTWITDEQATDPGYWARHLRQTVRFSDGVRVIGEDSTRILLEVGPGRTLSSFARQVVQAHGLPSTVVNAMRHVRDDVSDLAFLIGTVGKLWLAGYDVEWDLLYADETRHRVVLPTYPFEHKRYWSDAEPYKPGKMHQVAKQSMTPNDWFYAPAWKTSHVTGSDWQEAHVWLVFLDEIGVGNALAERLRQSGQTVLTVSAGANYEKTDVAHYVISPDDPRHYTALWEDVRSVHGAPERVVHLWNLSSSTEDGFDSIQRGGYFSLLRIAQTIANDAERTPVSISVIGNGLYQLDERDELVSAKATLLGAAKVLQQEMPFVTSKVVDLLLSPASNAIEKAVSSLLVELSSGSLDREIAYRGNQRWVKHFEALDESAFSEPGALVRKQGTYVILGGFGEIGEGLARYLAESAQARLVLVARGKLPERWQWDLWLQQHDEADATSRRIRQVLNLEALGSRVIVCAADVANEQEMRNVLQQARTEFGEVHGILHAAGSSGLQALQMITETSRDTSEFHFAPKVRGTHVLERILRDESIDFCLVVSSLSAELGGFGMYAYSSVHNFIDAFVREQNRVSSNLWLSFNWDDVTTNRPEEVAARALSRNSVNPFVISTVDLNESYREWVAKEPSQEEDSPSTEASVGHARPELGTIYVAPRTSMEEQIVALWQEMLFIDQIGIHDNFFELGGNSLIGTKFVNRLRQLFQVNLPLQTMFEAGTVAELAVAIEQNQTESSESQTTDLQEIPKRAVTGPAPLSFAQYRMWFADRLMPDTSVYNMPEAVRITGRLDDRTVQASFDELVRRHESLRTVFRLQEDEPVQVLLPARPVPIESMDLTQHPEEDREQELIRVAEREGNRPFDLENGPLLRVLLVRVAAEDHVLVFNMHHIISDGWSMGVLTKDFASLYAAFAAGEEPALPALPIQYADYAVWQREWLQGDVLNQQLTYWKQQLQEAPELLRLETDHPRPEQQSYRGQTETVELDPALIQGVQAFSQQRGATPYMFLLSVYNLLLHRQSGQADIVVGTPIANRHHNGTDGIIGNFVNSLAMRTRLREDMAFEELLQQVCDKAIGAYAHQDLPFEKLVEELHPTRTTAYNPIVQVWFNYLNAPMGALNLPGVTLESMNINWGVVRFDLSLDMLERQDGSINASLTYNVDLFRPATTRTMIQRFQWLLQAVLEQPGSTVGELLKEMDRTEEQSYKQSRSSKLKSQKAKAISISDL